MKNEQEYSKTILPASLPNPKPTKNPEKSIVEQGGRGGLEPTRYGDYEIAGKCVDF
jgi:hypothetical protein